MAPTRTYYELKRESRITTEKFYWHWSILAGGTLTLLVGYLKDIGPLPDNLATLFRWGLIGVLLSLIFAPLHNLFSSFILNAYAHSKNNETDIPHRVFEKRIQFLSVIKDCIGGLSIFVYAAGLIAITYVFIELYL